MVQKDSKILSNSSAADSDELAMPSKSIVNALHEKATSALAQIVRTADNGQYSEAEIKVVRDVLEQSAQSVTR